VKHGYTQQYGWISKYAEWKKTDKRVYCMIAFICNSRKYKLISCNKVDPMVRTFGDDG